MKVKMLFVFDNEHFVSILTIGDIQRAIVNNIALETPVAQVVGCNKKFAYVGDSMDNIREKNLLDQLLIDGVAPWKKWEREVPVIK